ncbi:SidA/IucD/PvdA family monooxygenase [Denitrobaculum tricleocarpae]|uniref:Ornithine monooxygenase n=1 Tax=Denitrobaculum tricleocarpae TaxID=2591009 RepID=A0A545U1J9_9PROT|nr:SidA/IucD/PvdA family monooxygenase [Denitrobaculum tricleocarpae]TQV83314.1 ornithine monooxygenase [Denitrobaculum tricleocarpae]
MKSKTSVCQTNRVYDCIGIGFGPSNIALAIALEERGLLENVLFLEARDHHSWHPNMMLPGTDIQHNPLRDLVTLRNPQSKYGFLCYLKENDRLLDYLNLSAPFPPRSEYTGYIDWVARQFSNNAKLSCVVSSIAPVEGDDPLVRVCDCEGSEYLARSLSFGAGRSPHIPEKFSKLMGDRVIHLTDYLSSVERWTSEQSNLHIGVVGGSQSAIEIILDINSRTPWVKVTNISRGFGFKQKDLSPFTEQIYYPEFVDYFYSSSINSQKSLTRELWRSNYGAADHDVIDELNFKLYEQKVQSDEKIVLLQNKEIENVSSSSTDKKIMLELSDRHSLERQTVTLDAVILATGFKNFGTGPEQEPYHPLLENLIDSTVFREDGGVSITRDYRLQKLNGAKTPPIYINGLCESSHGFGDAGSFSLLSIRAGTIAQSLEEHVVPT